MDDAFWMWDSDAGDDHEAVAVGLTRHLLVHRKLNRKKHVEEVVEARAAGAAPDEALGEKAKRIGLRDIRRVRYVARDGEVHVHYTDEGKSRRLAIGDEDETPHRAIFEALCERVAPGVTPYPSKLGGWEAAKKPLVALGITVAVAAALVGLYLAFEGMDEPPSSLKGKILYWVVDFLGLPGILGIGGLVAAGLVAWLVRRVGNPPEFEEVALP
jgi:hypothetical protein